jgi:hypothetical protein
MFRSSMAAFYPLARGHFYGRGCFPRDGFKLPFLRLHGRSEVKKIICDSPLDDQSTLFKGKIASRRFRDDPRCTQRRVETTNTRTVLQLIKLTVRWPSPEPFEARA